MALQSPFFNNNNKREDAYPRAGVSPNAAAASGQAAATLRHHSHGASLHRP